MEEIRIKLRFVLALTSLVTAIVVGCQDNVFGPEELGLTGANMDRRIVSIGGNPDRQTLRVEPDVFGWENSPGNDLIVVRGDRIFRLRKDGDLRPIPVGRLTVGDSIRVWFSAELSSNWVLAVAVIR